MCIKCLFPHLKAFAPRVALAPFTKEKSGLSAADIPEVGMMMFSMHIWAKLEKQPKIALVILQGQPMSFPYQHH